MLRKRSKTQHTDLSSTGAFIDTTGERKRRTKRRSKRRVEVTEEEERELESLVFGGQPFKPVEPDSGGDVSSEEVSFWNKSVLLLRQ